MGDSGRRLAIERFAVAQTIAQLGSRFLAAGTTRPAPSEGVASPALWAFYDLALPSRARWLEAEIEPLSGLHGRIVAAGGRADDKALASLGAGLWELEWLPDGIVLESEWRMRGRRRAALEELRTELATSVDGEIFLRAARRAVWLATRIRRAAQPPTLLYGAGVEESLAVWMASRLTKVPCALAFEEGTRWSTQILRRMAKEAVAVSDASGKVEGAEDVIGHTLVPPSPLPNAKKENSMPAPLPDSLTFTSWLQAKSISISFDDSSSGS
jgi:hypothetical protein